MAEKPASPHLFADVLARVHAICAALATEGNWPDGIDFSRVVVEPPRDASHGDMATNAAMVLAKEAGKKPRELADAIADRLRADPLIAKVEVAGPGFINLTLKPAAWIEALLIAIKSGHYEGVDLANVSFLVTFNMRNWSKIYLSDKVSEQQGKAVEALLPIAFAGFHRGMLSFTKAPITMDITEKRVRFSGPESSVDM